MPSGINPFEFGRELGPAELVDRDDELQELTRVLSEARKHFLIGPRRYGKSSLLAAAQHAAAAAGVIVLPYNVERYSGPEQLAARIVADAARHLTGTAEKVGAAIARLFRHLRPELSYNPAAGTWSATLGVAASVEPVPLLADALDGVERLAKQEGRPVAVVFDEFQHVVARGGVAAEGQLRAAVQQHRHVGYVFAGSDTRLLTALVGEADRPFYRLGSHRFLGPVPRDAFAAFLERGLGSVATVTADGVAAILDLAEDVPYNVQLLAHACWEAARDARATVTRVFVERVNRLVAERNNPAYAERWSALTPAQQRTLLAVLHEAREGLTSTAVARRYGVPVPTIQKSLRGLEAKHVLREEAVGPRLRLRLEDPLFGAWVRLFIPAPG